MLAVWRPPGKGVNRGHPDWKEDEQSWMEFSSKLPSFVPTPTPTAAQIQISPAE